METLENHKYIKLFHSLYHTFLFFGIIDILILKIYFNKSIATNLKDHINTATFIYITNLLNHYLIYFFDCLIFENYIYYIELILLGLLMLQIFLGLSIKNNLLLKKNFVDFYRKKFFHRIFGFFILIFGKFKMLKIWFYYLEMSFFFYCIIFLYFFFSLGSYFLIYFSIKKRGNSNITKFKILEEKTNKYWNIKKSIENDEYKINNSIINKNSFFSHNDSIYKEKKQEEKIKIDWIIFENKFYEIGKFNHPGGNFILSRIKEKDITKLIYGETSLIFYNYDTMKYKLLKHLHFYRAFEILKNKCIGPIKSEKIFKDQANNKTINLDENKSINFFDSKIYNIYNKLTNEKFSKKDFKYNIYKNFFVNDKIHLLFISPKKNEIKNNLVYLNNFWVNLIGKYFMLFSENNEKNFFWSVLSYNPNYLKIREKYLKNISEEFFKYNKKYEMEIIKNIRKLKDYEGDEYLSYFYPVCGDITKLIKNNKKENNFENEFFLKNEKNNLFENEEKEGILHHSDFDFTDEEENLKIKKKKNLKKKINFFKKSKNDLNNGIRYQFKGPLGIGLGINSYSTGKYLIIIKNEGILPFLDFFEILIQKCLLKLYEKKNIDWIFNSEYNLIFVNNLQIQIQWIISSQFLNFAKSFGLFQLQTLFFLQNQIKESCFNILKNVVIRNSNIKKSFYDFLTIKNSENFEDVKDLIDFDVFDKIVISGPDIFKKEILQGSRIDFDDVEKIVFIN